MSHAGVGPGGVLTQITAREPLYRANVIILLFIAAMVGVITLAFIAHPLYVWIGVALVALTFFVGWWSTHPETAARLGLRQIPIDEFPAALPKLRGVNPKPNIEHAAKRLAQAGKAGMTFRLAPALCELQPSPTPFEPRLLGDLSQQESDEHTRPQSELYRRIKLKGGWAILTIFGLNFLLAVAASVKAGRVTTPVFTWALALLAIMFVPVRFSLLGSKQWLLAPSALIRRTPRRDGGWDLKMFDRRASVLIVYHFYQHQWGLAVADNEASGSTIGTVEELDDALAAWLCPFPAPDQGRLSDLQGA